MLSLNLDKSIDLCDVERVTASLDCFFIVLFACEFLFPVDFRSWT